MSAFLTGLLASILRPIIQDEFIKLKSDLVKMWGRNERFKEYDQQAQVLMEQMANASTSEERWALLTRIKKSRPVEPM